MRLRGWAGFAVAALVLSVLANVFAVVAFLQRVLLIGQVETDPVSVTADDPAASDATVRAGSITVTVVALVATVALLGWMFASARRVRRDRPAVLRRGPGWAIGGWFVPFANLVLPAQTMNDLWAAGTPRPSPPQGGRLVAWWWGVLLTCSFASTAALLVAFGSRGDTLDGVRQEAVGGMVLFGLYAIADIATVVVVSRVSRRLDTMTPDVGQAPEPATRAIAAPAVATVAADALPGADAWPAADAVPAADAGPDRGGTTPPVPVARGSHAGAVVAVVVIGLLVLAVAAASWRLSRPGTGASPSRPVVMPQTLGGLPRSADSQITQAVDQARTAMAPQTHGEAFDVAGYGSPAPDTVALLFVLREQSPLSALFDTMGLSNPVAVGSSQCASSSAGLVVCARTAPGLTVMVEGNSTPPAESAMVDQAFQAQ